MLAPAGRSWSNPESFCGRSPARVHDSVEWDADFSPQRSLHVVVASYAALDHLFDGLHRLARVRDRSAVVAAVCEALPGRRQDAGPVDGVLFGDAVPVRPAVGTGFRPDRSPADIDSGAGGL